LRGPNDARLQLTAAPERALRSVEQAFSLPEFDYDFEDVEPTATDLDSLHRGKYPHDGSGPVKARHNDWSDVISDDIAKGSLQRWPMFCRTFGYQ